MRNLFLKKSRVKLIKGATLILSFLLVSLFAVGCSYQWRESEPDITSNDLMDLLTEISETSNASSSFDMSTFMSMALEDEGSAIYFSEAYGFDGSMGPIDSVVSFVDYGIFESDLQDYASDEVELEEAQIFFVDSYTESGRVFGLLVRLRLADSEDFDDYVFISNPEDQQVIDGEFTVSLQGDNGTILLSTYDFFDGSEDLNSVIQLKVSEIDSSGEVYLIGQFSTMVGFADDF